MGDRRSSEFEIFPSCASTTAASRENADGKPLPGAPGVHRWSIEAASPGNASITFVYRRPWETSVARRHEVVVDATAR